MCVFGFYNICTCGIGHNDEYFPSYHIQKAQKSCKKVYSFVFYSVLSLIKVITFSVMVVIQKLCRL